MPFFGHSLAFFSNSDALLERGLDYTGRTHEIYAIKVWRQKLYIITAPEDVAAAFRNNTSLNFDGHLNELLVNFGFKGEALRLAWYEAKPGESCYLPDDLITPRQKSLNRLTEEVYRQQLLPGEKMDIMCRVFINALDHTLQWNRLDFCTLRHDGDKKQVSLRALCRHTMVDAATRSMFGSHLHAIEPEIVRHMLEFNEFVWMIFFRYPDFLGSPAAAPRWKITKVLETFINIPEKPRSIGASVVHQNHSRCPRDRRNRSAQQGIRSLTDLLGVRTHVSYLRCTLTHYRANSNEYNISFWVLSHLLFEDTLLELVRAETEAAWSSGTLDVKYLCANSPNLDAIFCEALRLNGGAMVSRKVLAPTTISGRVLQPGHSIIIPSRQLHKNEDVWGADVNDFDAFRFAKKKSLARHSSYRPFGGGVTYCPGRVLAKEEVFGFVAIILHRYNIKLAQPGGCQKKQTFPRLDDSTPALGITGPVKSMDVVIEMSVTKPVG
ncbi:hypothetical protein N7G274_008401 [Stereocaulon virgatum]|uniref:Cytochrome P450 n=1 Tax=Stereocaulon virgatum TaxID=373712 RepID=A0ABR3ZYW8_9LECA